MGEHQHLAGLSQRYQTPSYGPTIYVIQRRRRIVENNGRSMWQGFELGEEHSHPQRALLAL